MSPSSVHDPLGCEVSPSSVHDPLGCGVSPSSVHDPLGCGVSPRSIHHPLGSMGTVSRKREEIGVAGRGDRCLWRCGWEGR